jgi:hypothetical protein
VPYSLYREVEAHIVQEVLTWEMAPGQKALGARTQARTNLMNLTRNLPAAYAEVESRHWSYRTPLFYKEPAGDPLMTTGQLLNEPSFPSYVHDIIYGPQYGPQPLLAMVVQHLK